MADLVFPKEYEGSVCEIKTMENALIATGRIKDIAPKFIKIVNKNKDLQIVDYGTLIKINVFNTKLGFRVLVGNVYTSTKGEISIVSIVSLVDHERRNFFRVDMNLEAKALFRRNEKERRPAEVDVRIKDMSLSGIRFATTHQFEPDTLVIVEVVLTKRRPSSLQCRIIRQIGEQDGETHQYGCELIYDDSNHDATDALCSFLFQKQREFLNSRASL